MAMAGDKFQVSKLRQENEKGKSGINTQQGDGHKWKGVERRDWRQKVPEQQEDDEWVKGLLKGKVVAGTENYPTDYLRT